MRFRCSFYQSCSPFASFGRAASLFWNAVSTTGGPVHRHAGRQCLGVPDRKSRLSQWLTDVKHELLAPLPGIRTHTCGLWNLPWDSEARLCLKSCLHLVSLASPACLLLFHVYFAWKHFLESSQGLVCAKAGSISYSKFLGHESLSPTLILGN